MCPKSAQRALCAHQADLQPHRVEYWLNAKPDAPVACAAQVTVVCEVYQHAPAIAEHGGHVISRDEKTGIQALERAAPTLPRQSGLVERPEYEYLRHGTQGLSANFDVATGEVVAPTVGPSRTAEDFAGHIAHTIATDPEAPWLFVVDQLNMHTSEALVRLVAAGCGRKGDLGEKEERGIWESMAKRAESVSECRHRIRVVHTPQRTRWLYHIGLWVSLVVR